MKTMKLCQTSKKESTQEKERKKKQRARTKKSMQANISKEMYHTKVKEPLSDETLPNFKERKHPRKGKNKKTKGKN